MRPQQYGGTDRVAPLALWEHPVQYFPRRELGRRFYTNLNFEAGTVALGRITELEPPRAYGFHWTTNNPMLPPEFGLRFEFGQDRILRVRSGPFQASHGVVPLMASMHIRLDHLGAAITAPKLNRRLSRGRKRAS